MSHAIAQNAPGPAAHLPNDAQPDPEPAVPSLPEPDPGVYHHEINAPRKDEPDNA